MVRELHQGAELPTLVDANFDHDSHDAGHYPEVSWSDMLGAEPRPHIHAHLFRHTGISQLVQQGMPEPAIRRLVGHQRPESLMPYLHLSDEFVELEFKRAQKGFDLSSWFGETQQGDEP